MNFEDQFKPPTRKRHYQHDRFSKKYANTYDDESGSDIDNLVLRQEKVDKDNDLWKTLPPEVRRKAVLSQSFIYLMLFVVIGIFLMIVNMYNVKQLERLKEEYHLEDNRPTPETWWHKALVYHIFVPSYKDSDGNGFGDLRGILFNLDHLHYLGIDAVLLSGFYSSSFVDLGKDISDFKSIDNRCGTMADFQTLVNALHSRSIKVLIEFIPNHTSRRHPWFLESRRGGASNYKNFYVWSSGRSGANGLTVPPNNWKLFRATELRSAEHFLDMIVQRFVNDVPMISQYGGSGWTLDAMRGEYYYHYYHQSMPDLNHREPAVKQEMQDIMRFWLDKGVDGVVLEGTHALFEVDDLSLDEPPIEKDPIRGRHVYSHIYTEDLPEIHDYLTIWREFFEVYTSKMNRSVPLIVHATDDSADDLFRYYHSSADAVFSRQLLSLGDECGGSCMHDLVESWLARMTEGQNSIWMVSTLTDGRISQFRGTIFQSAFNMLLLTLPGSAVVLYGDEIGLGETSIAADSVYALRRSSKLQQENGDVAATSKHTIPHSIMMWNNETNAGFSRSSQCWLPVSSNNEQQTVLQQSSDLSHSSILQVFNRLAALRKHVSFFKGQIQYVVADENLLSYTRFTKDSAPYLVVLNFGKVRTTVDLSLTTGVRNGKLIVHAIGDRTVSRPYKEGDSIDLKSLSLHPGDGMVIMLIFDMFFNDV